MYNYDWMNNYDRELMKEFNWFLKKINDRACIQRGFKDEEYEPVNRHGEYDPGLEWEVEYFHPTITLDDRMRYIAQVIANHTTSEFNILGNTIISHFYGARGVHEAITNQKDGYVDFDRIAAGDGEYVQHLRDTVDHTTKNLKMPVWGTTELHTSIQTAGRNFCREKYNDPERKFHAIDVAEWVASFKHNGVAKTLIDDAEHIQQAFKTLNSLRGIGEYYGFHCAASTSVLPFVDYNHDQRFVAPGPGAVYLINRMWPNAPKKLYDEAVYFMRENSDTIGLTDGVDFHPEAYNVDGIFTFPQDSLKYYGTEVLSCQFGIYLQIRNDPKACERRKVARVQDRCSLEAFL